MADNRKCSCLEVFGEDPDCALHGYDALTDENVRLRNALELAQAALSAVITPGTIKSTSIQHAWARCVEAEAAARRALTGGREDG